MTTASTVIVDRIKRFFLGRRKDFRDPAIYHRMALIPFLAWVGLGADGLSSSAYGPEEAFRTLGDAHLSRRRPGARHRADRVHHLGRLHPDHRALPLRRRRLRGGHQAARLDAPASSPAARCWSTTCSPSRSRSPRGARRHLQLPAAAVARRSSSPVEVGGRAAPDRS